MVSRTHHHCGVQILCLLAYGGPQAELARRMQGQCLLNDVQLVWDLEGRWIGCR